MALREPILRSYDRILVLEKTDPKNKDIGLVDPGVFEGKNNLHCVMDPSTLMWSFKYERGAVPPQLRDNFTSFQKARQQAEVYLKTKNIRVAAVKE